MTWSLLLKRCSPGPARAASQIMFSIHGYVNIRMLDFNFFYSSYKPSYFTARVSGKHKRWCESKNVKKHAHLWTWGPLKKYEQIINFQTTAAFPVEGEMNWHSIGGTCRLNKQCNWWKTKKKLKGRRTLKQLFYYEGWVKLIGLEENLGPHNWSAASVQEQFTTIADISLRIILSFKCCCSPEGKGTVFQRNTAFPVYLCICTDLWRLQTKTNLESQLSMLWKLKV